MNLQVITFTGDVYELNMNAEQATIAHVKAELGAIGFPWKLHLYPGVLDEDDSKNVECANDRVVHEGDILRSYVDSWTTWIVYPTKMNYLQHTTVDKLMDELWACCLETGERQPLSALKGATDVRYYMDDDDFLSKASFRQPSKDTLLNAINSLLRTLLPNMYYGAMTGDMRLVYSRMK